MCVCMAQVNGGQNTRLPRARLTVNNSNQAPIPRAAERFFKAENTPAAQQLILSSMQQSTGDLFCDHEGAIKRGRILNRVRDREFL